MSVKKYFLEYDYLASLINNYRYRPYQAEFSEKIYELMSSYKSVVAEAPTGYGKTLSYLIPIFELGRKTIISTKTKQLMNQILFKDISILRSIFGDKILKINSLVGRRNYFCHYRYGKYIVPYSDFYSDVVNWAESVLDNKVITVTNSGFDNEIISKITADSYQCIAGKCPYYAICSFYNAKELANSSDIIITNHHMLLADLAMRTKFDSSYNFDFVEHIVFDEAHSLVDIFPTYLGEELSFHSVINFTKDNRSFIGEEIFRNINSKYKTIVSKYKNVNKFSEKMETDCRYFIDELDKIFSKYLTDEEYSIFEKYRDTFEKIYQNEGVKIVETGYDTITIKNIPITSDKKFTEGLFNSCISALMISATISFNGSFDYFFNELDLGDNIEKIQLSPPENFISQGKLFINNNFMEDIDEKKEFYSGLLKDMNGAAIIIFNSIAHMKEIYSFIEENFKDKKLYYQTDDLTNILIDENSIVMGCSILREGVDFAGKGVKYVIIDKLPFENISDIYVKAKIDHYENCYGNAFLNYYLPRAVIFFKQAVGRLIRNESDTGYWIILDGRVLTKNYGKYFLDVLKGAELVDKIN